MSSALVVGAARYRGAVVAKGAIGVSNGLGGGGGRSGGGAGSFGGGLPGCSTLPDGSGAEDGAKPDDLEDDETGVQPVPGLSPLFSRGLSIRGWPSKALLMLATPPDRPALAARALVVKLVIMVLLVVDVLDVFGCAVSGCRLDDRRAAGRSVSAPLGVCRLAGGGVNGGRGRTINLGTLASGLAPGGLLPG